MYLIKYIYVQNVLYWIYLGTACTVLNISRYSMYSIEYIYVENVQYRIYLCTECTVLNISRYSMYLIKYIYVQNVQYWIYLGKACTLLNISMYRMYSIGTRYSMWTVRAWYTAGWDLCSLEFSSCTGNDKGGVHGKPFYLMMPIFKIIPKKCNSRNSFDFILSTRL